MQRVFYLIFLFFCTCMVPQYLTATAIISGTVTDSITQLPISGALVEAVRGGQVRYSDTTAPDGTYSLTDVEPSNYTLVFSAPGYQTQSLGVNPKNNQITLVDVELVPNGGTIDGTVTDATTLNPISGATIRIFQGTDLIQTTTTNGVGFYSAPNLAPGNYIVLASASTYQTQFKGASVQVSTTTIVDFALESNPGAISGTVTDALTTNPIEGALVVVFDGVILMGFADTDVSGNYTISGLAPGSYSVTAVATGYQAKTVGASVVSAVTTTVDFALEQGAGTIEGVVTDASTGNPIPGASIKVFQGVTLIASVLTDTGGQYSLTGFAPGNYLVSANANTYQLQIKGGIVTANATTIVNFSLISDPGTISGQVTDAVTTDPISGATINVYSGQVLIATALTDPNGNYQIPNLSPGNYNVTASKTDYQTQVVGATVTAGATTIVNFSLEPNPGTISGTVTDAVTTNPIEGANILVFSGQTFIATVVTDVNGNYAIPNLAPGQYTVIASAGSNYQIASQGATVLASITTTVNFALQPDPGAIEGTVTKAANGSPIPGTNILVFSNFTVVASALTDANGQYSIEGLAPGNYTVTASAPNFSISAVGASVTANNTTIVNFALTANPGTISGTVTDASTTNPIPGATIQVRNGLVLIATAISDANGNYNIPGLEPDTYIVTARAPTFQSQTKIATVSSNQTTIVDFALNSNPGAISGTVTDAVTADPISNATVAVFQGTTFIGFALTDVNGEYTIPDLAPGNYTVLAIAQGYQSAFSAKTVVAGATTDADFALDPNPGTIAGIVTDRCTDNPIPGAFILVTDGSTIVGFGLTNASGSYSIDTLAPGNYTVTAAKRNFLIGSSPATITANTTIFVNFSLTPTILPPARIAGCAIKNEFLTQTDLIHVISWTASPSSCVTGYQIFRNCKQIAFVSSKSKLEYQDHNRSKKRDVYSVKAVNSFGMVSDAVSVTVDAKSKCPKKKPKRSW